MAATKRNAMLIAETRSRIQTTQLIKRLQDHVDGKVEMSKTQVTAANILLSKSLPSLQAISLGDETGDPISFIIQHAPKAET